MTDTSSTTGIAITPWARTIKGRPAIGGPVFDKIADPRPSLAPRAKPCGWQTCWGRCFGMRSTRSIAATETA